VSPNRTVERELDVRTVVKTDVGKPALKLIEDSSAHQKPEGSGNEQLA